MSQQEELEARYKQAAEDGEIPHTDPFPRMILVCIGITIALLFIIMACIFVDFVILRPGQNVREHPIPAVEGAPAPTETTPETGAAES